MRHGAMNFIEFQSSFSTEEACLKRLYSQRWPNGYVCPRCGHRRHYFHSIRRLYQCCECDYQVSATAGTIFHKTRTPLRKWFCMIFLMTRQKYGASMMSMQRMLDIKSYKTIWTMGHKIRKAMADRDAESLLAGLMQLGGDTPEPNLSDRRDKGTSVRPEVVVTVQTQDDILGFTAVSHCEGIEAADSPKELQDSDRISNATRNHTWSPYGTRGRRKAKGASRNQEKSRPVNTPWLAVLVSNVKGNIRGVHHGVSDKHLERYLNEFAYRFNRRSRESQLFSLALTACLTTRTVTFTELTK